MNTKEKAIMLLDAMSKIEAIQFCNDCLSDLGYNEDSVGIENEDLYNIALIENLLKIKTEVESI